MRMLELFSGTGRMAAAFREKGYKTLTVDLNEKADIQANIMRLSPQYVLKALGGRPNVIWASPPCTQFSIAAVGKHWKDRMPPADTELFARTLYFIMALEPDRWFIENPVGMARKLRIMRRLPRKTLTFCCYGDDAMKPTDVFTNVGLWNPKRCRNGMLCHEAAPRGSKTGTQGKKGAKERGALPVALCREVAAL